MNLDTDFLNIHKNHNHGNFDKIHDKVIGDDKEYSPSHIFDVFNYCSEIFLWGADYYLKELPCLGSWFVWDKVEGQFKDRIGNEFELCWSKKTHKKIIIRKKWVGHIGLETQDKNERLHPTQKPFEVVLPFIEKFSKQQSLIVDLFGGSGTTLIAAEATGRHCNMMEISEAYTQIIISRYLEYTNQTDIIINGKTVSWQEYQI